MRASPLQGSFNAGEFSPRLFGRVDVGKYSSACALLEGFIPLIQGPGMRRGGTRYLGAVKDRDTRTWLVRFEFNTQQAYQLEFGERYIRFWSGRGQVIVTGVAAYSGATPYAIGDLVVQGGVNYYCVATTTGNAPPNPTYWYALTGNIYEIPTPYLAADLTDADGNFRLRVVESADVVYIAHGSYAPRKLARLGSTRWTLSTAAFAGGPFKPENITATTIYADAATGNVTVTASAAIFSAGLVGSLLQLSQKSLLSVKPWEAAKSITTNDLRRSAGKNYKALNTATTGGDKPSHTSGAEFDGDAGVQWQYLDPGFGCVQLTGYTSPTVMTGTVVSPFPANPASQLPADVVGGGNATTRWALAAWSGIEGWPTQVAFFRERLCFGRGTKLWLSVSGDYETFTARDQSGLVTTDMAISDTLQGTKVNDIQWMQANSSSVEALVCGTAGSEFAYRSMTENSPFGTDNKTGTMISTLGSRNTVPVDVNGVLLFIQRAGSKLRDVTYDFYTNRFQSVDQSVMAEHIPKVGINQIVYQQEPYSLIWAARTDGALVCMTYSREQYPEAPHGGWHRHPIGGDGFVESLSVIPAEDNSRDELWMIVRRTIDGVTGRYVEVMEWERRPNDDPEDSFYLDCGLTLDNAPATYLSTDSRSTIKGELGVPFNAGAAVFDITSVGKQIHYRYFTTNENGVKTFATAKATITNYNDPTAVDATIEAPFPAGLGVVPAGGWRITVTTISGLDHLEGETVDILINGATHPQRVVESGSITLQYPSSKVQVGLKFPTRLKTLRLNAGARDGTSQGKKSSVKGLVVRLLETLGLRYGASFDDLMDMSFRNPADPTDAPPPIFSGDKAIDWPGQWDTAPWLCFSQDDPLPVTIVALMPQVDVSEKG